MKKARIFARGICTIAAAGVVSSAGAETQVVPSLTISGGALYSSNPFLTPGPEPEGSAAVSIDVAPSVEILSGRLQAIVSGNIGYTQYLGDLGSTSGYRVQGVLAHKTNDRLTLNGRVGFDSSILGARTFNDPLRSSLFAPIIDPASGSDVTSTTTTTTIPAVQPPPLASGFGANPVLGTTIVDSDLGLLGARQRRNLWNASAGLEYRVSARSTWSGEVNLSRATYPGAMIIAEDYTSYGATIAYRRALTETMTVGAGLGASRVNYAGGLGTSVYSPRVTISQRFRGGLSWNASAGVAIVSQATGSTTSAFADASLCRTADRSALCLAAFYAPSVTGVGSVRNQLGVSGTYSYRLAERTSLSASLGYNRITAQTATVSGLPFARAAQSFFTGDVAINRRISRTLSGYAGASYRKLEDSSMNVAADYGVRAGLAVTLGSRR